MVTILLVTGRHPAGKNFSDLLSGSTGHVIPVESIPEARELGDREHADAIVALYEGNEVESLSLLRALRGRGDNVPFVLFLETFNSVAVRDVLSLNAAYFVRPQSAGDCSAGLAKVIGNAVECRSLKAVVTEQEKKIDTLFYQSPIGKELFDSDGSLVDVNEACLEIFGVVDKKELRNFNLLRDPNLTEIEKRQLLAFETVRAEQEFDFEKVKAQHLYQTTRSGSIFLDILISPICENGNKTCSGYLVHVQDITRQKQIHESLARLNKKLNLVGSVTRHDVLNQLTAVVGYTEILDMMIEDPKLKSYLEKERQAIDKIQRQFKFAKEYQNIGVESPDWQNIRSMVSRVKEVLDLPGIAVTVSTESSIYADPLFEKVIYNLFENSIRHGQKVSEIRISLKEEESAALLIVEDNGVGIPASEKTKIFERGYGKNTGWGLFLIVEILSITGLSIAETGESGKGARFEIRVPKGKYRLEGRDGQK